MSTPVIPINLLTHQAIRGLVIFPSRWTPQHPDAAVLDDWLKEHGVDVQQFPAECSKSTAQTENARDWYRRLVYEPQAGFLAFQHLHLLNRMADWLPPCPP